MIINIPASRRWAIGLAEAHPGRCLPPCVAGADLVRKVTVKTLGWQNLRIFPGPHSVFITETVHQVCYICRLSEPAGHPGYLHSFSSFEAVIIIRCQLCADTEFYFVWVFFFNALFGSKILASVPYTVIPWVTELMGGFLCY